MQRFGLTFLIGSPTNLALLARAQSANPRDLSTLNGIVTMGAPLEREACLRYQELLTPRIFNGYGTTEAFWNTFLRPEDLPEHAGTAGRSCTDDDVEQAGGAAALREKRGRNSHRRAGRLLWTPGPRIASGGTVGRLRREDSTVPATVPAAPAKGRPVRFATFNASLFRPCAGELAAELAGRDAPQLRAVAETIQRTRPDVLLLNEFEYDPAVTAIDGFREHYLAVSQHGAEPIHYPYIFTAAVNSGVQTGFDLDRDGAARGPHDAHGYGHFFGQYGMLVLSRYPIELTRARTFQTFRWTDMPAAMLPADPYKPDSNSWYPDEALGMLRLSSRSHWDIPIRTGSSTIHLLAAHPTPPVFDGPERRNQLRNHDEIRFLADYVRAGCGDYIYDDQGSYGGLATDEPFVIAGDLNADPSDGFCLPGSISRLLHAPRVRDPKPGSSAGVLAALRQLRNGRTHVGNPFHHTTNVGDEIFGNMRLDYVLPSRELTPVRHSVFWPTPGTALARLNGFSDHHLVWLDALVPTPVR